MASNKDPDAEKQFLDDLEKAKALSLETLALEQYEKERKRRHTLARVSTSSTSTSQSKFPTDRSLSVNLPSSPYLSSQRNPNHVELRRTSVDIVSPNLSLRSSNRDASCSTSSSSSIHARPRPGGFVEVSSMRGSVSSIAPPPIPRRQASVHKDLISFVSPAEQSIAESPTHDPGLNPPPFSASTPLSSVTSTPDPLAVLTSTFTDQFYLSYNQQVGQNLSSIGVGRSPFQPSVLSSQNGSSYHGKTTVSLWNFSQEAVVKDSAPVSAPASITRRPFPFPVLEQPASVSLIAPNSQSMLPLAENRVSAANITRTRSAATFMAAVLESEGSSKTDLIDLTKGETSTTSSHPRNSILCAFDPLMETSSSREESTEEPKETFYNVYDPFDYMHELSKKARHYRTESIYEVMTKEHSPVKAKPSAVVKRNEEEAEVQSLSKTASLSLGADQSNSSLVLRKVEVQQIKYNDLEVEAFLAMIRELRSGFRHDDVLTNPGLIISPTIDGGAGAFAQSTSLKLVVSIPSGKRITFTADITSSVEHIISYVMVEEDDGSASCVSDFVLKVWGRAEYLAADSTLQDYEYVHSCIKYDRDVKLRLVRLAKLKKSLARTAQDDIVDSEVTLEDLLPSDPIQPLHYDSLRILLEILDKEADRILHSRSQTSSKSITQAVKAVCALLGDLETLDVTNALLQLSESLNKTQNGGTVVLSENGPYAQFALPTAKGADFRVSCGLNTVYLAVADLIIAYQKAFRVDFALPNSPSQRRTEDTKRLFETVRVRICAVHRPSTAWAPIYQDFLVKAELFYGTTPIAHPVTSRASFITENFFPRIVYDEWLEFESMALCTLPREIRLVLTFIGRRVVPEENGGGAKDKNSSAPTMIEEDLGWAALQYFSCQGLMAQGKYLLMLWPPNADKRLGPSPFPGTHPLGDVCPIFSIEMMEMGYDVQFPTVVPSPVSQLRDFSSLDDSSQQELLDVIQRDPFSKLAPADREVLWEKRHYLHKEEGALPLILLAAQSWDWASLSDLHGLVLHWLAMQPIDALQLLLPIFPDSVVRSRAVHWLKTIGSDELVDYLPQLVQALKYETWDASPLAKFLLERSMTSPRLAHYLYWLLIINLPGNCPQNSDVGLLVDDLGQARYQRRFQLLLRALLAICGSALRERFMTQQLLTKSLSDVADTVKSAKDSLRITVLLRELESVHFMLQNSVTSLPLSPALEVKGMVVKNCSYFTSNTLPLKLQFQPAGEGEEEDGEPIAAIFKVGDDLRQDMLTLQMIRIMDKLWLKDGLNLRIVTFGCIPTGPKKGVVELVSEAETLRKIQQDEAGLTGAFQDRPLAQWLAKYNPSQLEYQRAVMNFTASCAGYCVATYVLGICDRHNDNIMLTTSGHLFHIDFGKFLGDAQMFGNFKRDRVPFVLTSDMAYVINGGDKPSWRFQNFVDLCCQAFNVLRKHSNIFINLFTLMASSGIPGVTSEAVSYIHKALLLNVSNAEASAYFAKLIDSSLKSWFTQFNFFLHGLAQLRFTGDQSENQLLSFVPKTYTMALDGKIENIEVHGFQKRYNPEKYYVYILRVTRQNQKDPTYLFRTYREFLEFHQKLCLMFPLAKYHSLPRGVHLGRTTVKAVAEKRLVEIDRFLRSLMTLAPEVAHSDLTYTFFHPLLIDQDEANIHTQKLKESKSSETTTIGTIEGQIKLSLQYTRGQLLIMVHHARELASPLPDTPPSPYVKAYLVPDTDKVTKRKTRVVRRNANPTFMEMLVYRMPLDLVRHRTLQLSVWSYDRVQENSFLGATHIDLSRLDLNRETCSWYKLGNLVR